MDLKRLRRGCELRLRSLDLPVPFDVRGFCDTLGTRRGRLIRLCPVSCPAGPCGLWAAGTQVDYIFYEQATTPLHQEHIILHEVSHLLCGHRPEPLSDEECAWMLFPDLDAEMIRRVLGRAGYSADEEQEAELLASLILDQVAHQRLPQACPADPEVGSLLERLEAVLEQPRDA
jgi:hypothetical protein